MLKRKIYSTLLEWKKNHKDECLLIKGARQAGKTYAAEYLGKHEYESFIEITLLSILNLKTLFKDL